MVNNKTPVNGNITLTAEDILNGETSVAAQINDLVMSMLNNLVQKVTE